jgi:hypothetical protein
MVKQIFENINKAGKMKLKKYHELALSSGARAMQLLAHRQMRFQYYKLHALNIVLASNQSRQRIYTFDMW